MASFDKCFVFDRFPCFFQGDKFVNDAVNFILFKYSSILSYYSVCYSSLSLLNIHSWPYIFRCENLSCTLFSLPFSIYFDDKIYLVVIITPQWLTYLDIINIFQYVLAPAWF